MKQKTYYDYLRDGLQDVYDYINGDKSKGYQSTTSLAEPIREGKKKLKIAESSKNEYMRYMVKITPYKGNYKLDYIDSHFDKSGYCFFDVNGDWLKTGYYSIDEELFNKLYYLGMKPGKVYGIYTDGPYGGVTRYEEIPANWFRI